MYGDNGNDGLFGGIGGSDQIIGPYEDFATITEAAFDPTLQNDPGLADKIAIFDELMEAFQFA